MKNLGSAYFDGRGVEKNMDLALEWYEQGREEGRCQRDV